MIEKRLLLSAGILTGAFVVSLVVAYSLLGIARQNMVRGAVRAYWEEEERMNNIRLFGDT